MLRRLSDYRIDTSQRHGSGCTLTRCFPKTWSESSAYTPILCLLIWSLLLLVTAPHSEAKTLTAVPAASILIQTPDLRCWFKVQWKWNRVASRGLIWSWLQILSPAAVLLFGVLLGAVSAQTVGLLVCRRGALAHRRVSALTVQHLTSTVACCIMI